MGRGLTRQSTSLWLVEPNDVGVMHGVHTVDGLRHKLDLEHLRDCSDPFRVLLDRVEALVLALES